VQEGELFIAEAVAHMMRPLVQSQVRETSTCVLSTRIAIEVLGYFEIAATPQPVEIHVINQAMADWIEAGYPGGVEHGKELGAWGVSTIADQPAESGKWAGHLIVRLDDAFIDSDLGAYSRPHRSLVVPDGIVLGADADPPWGYDLGGVHLVYTPTTDVSWKESIDWNSKGVKKYAGPMIRAIKKKLSA
jgi:hypothetical protein